VNIDYMMLALLSLMARAGIYPLNRAALIHEITVNKALLTLVCRM